MPNDHKKAQPLISIIVPMYNEQEVAQVFLNTVTSTLELITQEYEIICINDGSKDQTLPILISLHQQNPRIKIINFTRNFGKDASLSAGFDFASGQATIPMDSDFQDPPEMIPKLVAKWQEGFDMVLAIRDDRSKDSFFKRTSAKIFYNIASKLSNENFPKNAGDFRLLDRKMVDVLKQLPERSRFMKGLFSWIGFNQTAIYYQRPKRFAGKTKWSYWKLWNFALDGIFSFSTLPLRLWSYLGISLFTSSIIYLSYIVFKTFIYGVDVPGYASIVVIILFFSGLNMLGLGVIGEYLGRTFIEVKNRPIYLVYNTTGFTQKN